MDNAEKVNNFINITLAQTFRSCLRENQYAPSLGNVWNNE
jgi:hypothetical protein